MNKSRIIYKTWRLWKWLIVIIPRLYYNGYIIKLLHENIPTLQLYGNKKEKKYQWIALYNILKYLDKQLSNIMEDKHELSKKLKKKIICI